MRITNNLNTWISSQSFWWNTRQFPDRKRHIFTKAKIQIKKEYFGRDLIWRMYDASWARGSGSVKQALYVAMPARLRNQSKLAKHKDKSRHKENVKKQYEANSLRRERRCWSCSKRASQTFTIIVVPPSVLIGYGLGTHHYRFAVTKAGSTRDTQKWMEKRGMEMDLFTGGGMFTAKTMD